MPYSKQPNLEKKITRSNMAKKAGSRVAKAMKSYSSNKTAKNNKK
jgi:hypothetical protein